MNSPYFPSNLYSLGYWLKEYAFYPKKLPLFIWMDHGIALRDIVAYDELNTTAALVLKFSPKLVEDFKNKSQKPVYCILNPTIYCRIKRGYKQKQDANGTLFFVAHSTDLVEDLTNWNEFVDELEKIPAEFGPVDICLHPVDIEKGLDEIFIKRGYKVFNAGTATSDKYADNLYNILINYRYSMSNLCGSYHAYSVDLGIPFSLYGQEPLYFNNGDKNLEKGQYNSFKEQSIYQKAISLFTGFQKEVTKEQKEFVDYILGKNHTISRLKAAMVLYKALVIHIIKHPGVVALICRNISKPATSNNTLHA